MTIKNLSQSDENKKANVSPDEAKNKADKCRGKSKQSEKDFKETEANRKLVLDKLKELKITEPILNSLITLSIRKFLNEININIINNKKLVNRLNPILEIVERSVSDRSINRETTDYYRIKNLSFEPGNKFEQHLPYQNTSTKVILRNLSKEKTSPQKK